MKNKWICLCVALFCAAFTEAKTAYVKPAANSQAWKNKPAELVLVNNVMDAAVQDAAKKGCDEVWFAEGNYVASALSPTSKMKIRGSFSGTENYEYDRSWQNFSVLDAPNADTKELKITNCDLDGLNFKLRCSVAGDVCLYNCVFQNYAASDNSEQSALVIAGGTTPRLQGDTIFGGSRVVGCYFVGNKARNGGALKAYNAVIASCTFLNNHSYGSGGAVYLSGINYIENCFFNANTEGKNAVLSDVYGGNCYRSNLRVDSNLLADERAIAYGANTKYIHSDSYYTLDNHQMPVLLNAKNSPFIDAGKTRVYQPSKTLKGVNRLCDNIDFGAFEFQKIRIYLDSVTVERPSFIPANQWQVKDSSFAITKGINQYVRPGDVLSMQFVNDKSFMVSRWNFRGDNNPTKSVEWNLEKGNTVNYETAGNVYDTLHISAVERIDTFRVQMLSPDMRGIKKMYMQMHDGNTSLSADQRSAWVYPSEKVTLHLNYDTAHFHFVGWAAENTLWSKDTCVTVNVRTRYAYGEHREHKLYAIVNADTLKVDSSIQPNNTYGNVSFSKPLNEVLYGDTLTMKAEPALGRYFVCWRDSCATSVSSIADTVYHCIMQQNHHFTAIFDDIQYPVTVRSVVINNPAQTDSLQGIRGVSGVGVFSYGQSSKVSVVPADGYELRGYLCPQLSWDTLRADVDLSFITQAYQVQACLYHRQYKVTVSHEPAEWPVEVSCDRADGTYFYGETPVITASDTLRMKCWEIATPSGWETYSLASRQVEVPSITKNTTLRAVYSNDVVSVQVTTDQSGLGEVAYKCSSVFNTKGSTLTCRALPRPHCRLKCWKSAGKTISQDSVFTFTLSQDTSVMAVFDSIRSIIKVENYVINNVEHYQQAAMLLYDYQVTPKDTLEMLAIPFKGYEFVGWVDPLSPNDTIYDNPCAITNVTSNKQYRALYQQPIVTLTTKVYPFNHEMTIEGDGKSHYYLNEVAHVRVTDTKRLMGLYSVSNDDVWYMEMNDDYTLDIPMTESKVLMAIYSDDILLVDLSVSDSTLGSLDYEILNDDYFRKGDTVVAQVTPRAGAQLRCWQSGNGTPVAYNETFSFVLSVDTSFVAVLEPVPTQIIKTETEGLKLWQPVDNKVCVRSGNGDIAWAVLCSAQGAVVCQRSVNAASATFNLPQAPGVYLLGLRLANGQQLWYKLLRK